MSEKTLCALTIHEAQALLAAKEISAAERE